MRVFIGMETSGALRRRFSERGHDVISCDILPAKAEPGGRHIVGDVFETLDRLRPDWWPDLAIFHPTCTFHTVSAAWAFGPGPYHQKVKPATLVGAARIQARELAEADVRRIWALDIKRKAIENPVGTLSTRWRKPSQIIQPYQFGDDASKATCLWLDGLMPLTPTTYIAPTLRRNGSYRWANQTDTGQNRLSPSDDRWSKRSDTFPGIADAMAQQWSDHV